MKLNNETIYSISLKTNKRLNEICSTWYHIPKNTLLNGHLLVINFQSTDHIDQRSIMLFYCRFGEGDWDPCIERRKHSTEIQQSAESFFRENQRFCTNFSGERKKYRKTKKNIKDLQLAYEKTLQLFKEKRKKNKEENW